MHWAEAGDITEFAEGTDYCVKGDDGIYTKLAADEAFVEGETYYLNTAKTWNGDWLDFYDTALRGHNDAAGRNGHGLRYRLDMEDRHGR